jgi:hypothetical protein
MDTLTTTEFANNSSPLHCYWRRCSNTSFNGAVRIRDLIRISCFEKMHGKKNRIRNEGERKKKATGKKDKEIK